MNEENDKESEKSRVVRIDVTNYFIIHGANAHEGENAEIGYFSKIQLTGNKTGDDSLYRADLWFYPNGDVRIGKPFFDEPRKTINVFYPMRFFEKILFSIQSGNNIVAQFYESPIGTKYNFELSNGKNPL